MPPVPTLPAIAAEPLSVILLAHQDAAHLEATVNGWLAWLANLGRPSELIVADDGSSDGSAALLDALAARHTSLKVLHLAEPQGEGACLRQALPLASRPLIFYTLCDPHFQPADLQQLLSRPLAPGRSELEIDHVHLVSAARAGRRVPWPLRLLGTAWRLFGRLLLSYAPPPRRGWLGWRSLVGHLLSRILFGLRYEDVACPFRLLRRHILPRIPLQSDGPFVHVELLAKANFLGMVLGEEMPLAAGHYPVGRPRGPHASLRAQLAEARRLLRHADFGPAVLPVRPEEAVSSPV